MNKTLELIIWQKYNDHTEETQLHKLFFQKMFFEYIHTPIILKNENNAYLIGNIHIKQKEKRKIESVTAHQKKKKKKL